MDFEWFVDGNIQDSAINFTDTFNNGINSIEQYEVVLTGASQYACNSSDTVTVTVYPDPIAIINTSGSLLDCAPLIIDSTLIHADSLNTIANDDYSWTITHYDNTGLPISPPTTGTGFYPPVDSITTDNDSVQVILSVNNQWGCKPAADTIMIYTIEDPIADFILDKYQGCDTLFVQSNTTSNSTNGQYTWEVFVDNAGILTPYGAPITTTTISTPLFTLTNSSNQVDSLYTIQLTVGDTNGCNNIFSIDSITVFPRPQANYILSSSDICPDGSVIATDSSISGSNLTYSWSITPNASIVPNTNNDTITITFPNNSSGNDSIYNLTLSVTDTNTCTNTYNDSIIIHTNPIAAFTIDPTACGPDTLTPTNNSQFQDTCLWSVNSPTIGISDQTSCNPRCI